MLRYSNFCSRAIKVELRNDYSIIAIADWDNHKKKNYISFYIKHKSVDMLDLCEDTSNVPLECNPSILKEKMVELVEDLNGEGVFKRYIERYEYMLKCFELGTHYLETGDVPCVAE